MYGVDVDSPEREKKADRGAGVALTVPMPPSRTAIRARAGQKLEWIAQAGNITERREIRSKSHS